MTIRRIILFLLIAGLTLIGWMYWTAVDDPVVRTAEVGLADWPAGESPVRAVLISDIHVAGPDMPPARLARIVAQIEALTPTSSSSPATWSATNVSRREPIG